MIDNNSNRAIGLGFMVDSTRRVWTCAIPSAAGNYAYVPRGPAADPKSIKALRYDLKIEGISVKTGLALFSTDADVTQTPLKRANAKALKVGDSIWYLKESQSTPAEFAQANISSAGVSARPDGTQVKYFEAESIPYADYVCGPVLNADGAVVGFIGEIWQRINPTSGTPANFLRAFEVGPVEELLKRPRNP